MSALAGTIVLDLTRHLPGPLTGQLLADYGARVIKVEDRAGDPVRLLPPFDDAELSTAFRTLNSGKTSIALDLKHPDGKATFLALVEKADVVLEGFRPGVLDRLGCGWDACRARNPRLVFASLSGYGPEGPYADKAGHDLTYQAYSGALATTRAVPGVQFADVTGTLAAFSGILLALVARARTGEGQRVAASLYQTAFALQPFQLVPAARGEHPQAAWTLAGNVPCYRVYRTKDERGLAVSGLEPKFWDAFCETVGMPEWIGRGHDPDLIPEVEALVATRTLDEWRLLENVECCTAGVLSPLEATRDPQAVALGLVLNGEDGRAARLAPPIRLDGTPATPSTRAPLRPGEHTREVLAELLGYDRERLETLRARGAVFFEARSTKEQER